MAKRRNKILFAILVVLLLAITIIGLISCKNNSIAYSLRDIQDFGGGSDFLSNPNLYCLTFGKDYAPNTSYYCYDVGNVSAQTAYVVAQQVQGKRDKDLDLIANAIWVLEGESNSGTPPLQGTAELNELLAKADLAASITASGNISIIGPTSPNVENSDGKYGPFRITYPSYNGQVFAITTGGAAQPIDTLVITVNGKQLSYIPSSGVDFYLTESDGIKNGEENVIEVTYKGYRMATSSYAKFTPKREVIRYGECEECGGTYRFTSTGYVANGYAYDISNDMSTWNIDWNQSTGHLDSECTGAITVERTVYYYDSLQNLIYILPMVNSVQETVDTKFWAGKPNINIDLNKVNPKNEEISGVEFNVTIEGGTLGTSTGVTSSTISGNSSFKIVPSKGADTVRVKLEETVVPEDYVKFTTPIIIEYNWNGTEWEKNIVQLPLGVTEGKSITVNKTGTNRQSSDCSDSFEITIVNRPVIRVTLNKTDPQGNSLDKVIFDIKVDGGTAKQSTIKDGETVIIEPTEGQDDVKVTLTEQDPGEEFVKYEDPIEMNFNFDGEKWNLGIYSKPEEPEKVEIDSEENKVTIKAINRRKIIVNLYKTDNASSPNPLSGIIFDVKVNGGQFEGESTDNTVKTDERGYAEILIIPDGTQDVTLELTERDDKYYINPGNITIKFAYQGGYWQPDITTSNNNKVGNITINGNVAEFDLNIENIAKIEDLTLVKINKYFPDEKIAGVTFEIQLGNARTLAGASSIIRQTDDNGQIEIGELEVIDPSKDITVTLTETGAPETGLNYKGLSGGTITITLKHKQSGCNVSATGSADSSLVEAKYDLENNVIEVVLQNEVTLDLSGRVWLDGQTGIKPVSSPNGLQDNTDKENEGIEGIEVSVKAQGNTTSSGTNSGDRTTVTGAKGKYEFKDLPASTKGNIEYYIEFTYDGINYIVTTPNAGDDSIDSDVAENPDDRTDFNNRFHTIKKDEAISRDGQPTTLEYDYDTTSATLKTKDSNGNVKDEFAMVATTRPTTYTKNTANIDMGLVKRGVNLAAFTDIERATVSINGKTKEYDYNDISQIEETDEDGNLLIKDLEIENKQYNLFLYNSDYNYRIGDYKLPAAQTDSLAVNATGNSTALQTERANAGELNVEVTYQVLLNNRSATNATINEFAYYYDQRYELIGVQSPDAGYNIVSNSGNKLVISGTKEYTDTDNQSVLELTFMLKKDNNGRVELGTMQNWVEITSYSTDEGCIDYNSAPDNMQEHSTEDDTDDAPGLVVQLNNSERQTSGYVFEDSKSSNEGAYNTGNGLFDSGENPIDDVIVQLIEVKNVTVGSTTLRLEYIWQETVSGSSTVRYVTSDGKSEGTYNVTNEPGQYTFNMNIIPGDYIVRFIYGDNTYWDTAKDTSNLLKYNGQDYKSTIDAMYQSLDWSADYYKQNSSMARDNEARRLEQIAKARTISETDATQLIINPDNPSDKTKLDNTWMCAETSVVVTEISKDVELTKSETHGDSGDSINNGINFGLVGRPKAVLKLEKHLTKLEIGGLGVSEVTLENCEKAKTAPDGIIVEQDLESNQAGVVASVTIKDEDRSKEKRGAWTVQTETSTIAGKMISITYGYTVENIGDMDFIGQTLNERINKGNSYSDIANDVKELSYVWGYRPGAYLGAAYYNGNVTTQGQSPASIPFQIEDYVSTTNGLQADLSGYFSIDAGTKTKYVWDYTERGKKESGATKNQETVNAVQTPEIMIYTNENTYNAKNSPLTLRVYNNHVDSISGNKEIKYRSYAAQLIYPTSGVKTGVTGILSEGMTLGNLAENGDVNVPGAIQSYIDDLAAVSISDITPEPDEFIAETVIITLDTGADKETPTMLIVTITAGLAIVAVGIVLIKKFIIK